MMVVVLCFYDVATFNKAKNKHLHILIIRDIHRDVAIVILGLSKFIFVSEL